MPKLDSLLRSTADSLASHGLPTPRLDAEVLLAYALGTTRSWLHAHTDTEITVKNAQVFQKLVERRQEREPVAYITGTKEFYGREFTVTPDVLIPRPETEDLVELALKIKQPQNVLDVGCGSGCIGITLQLERPAWTVHLVDISPKALAIARQNAEHLGAPIASYVKSDVVRSVDAEPYDMIVANLPYVDTSWETSPETAYEPSLALYADKNGLSLIFNCIEQSAAVLRDNALLLLEADPEQHQAIIDYAALHHFAHNETSGYALSFMKQPQA